MSGKPIRIIIPQSGISTGEQNPRAVYDPMSHNVLAAIGQTSTMRASHVDAGKDMSEAALEALRQTQTLPCACCVVVDGPTIINPVYAEHWFADMTPTGHNVVLGPYPPGDRDRALQEEVEWLHAHNIPVCQSCTYSQDKPTGRTSSADPELQHVPVPDGPNIQFTRVRFKVPENQEFGTIDFSKAEAAVISHMRRMEFVGYFQDVLGGSDHRAIAAINSITEVDDVISCRLFRESQPPGGPDDEYKLEIKFDTGQLTLAAVTYEQV